MSAAAPRPASSQSAPRAAAAPAPVARMAEPPPAPEQPALAVARFEDLIALATERRDLVVKTALERDVRLVRFEDGKLEIALEPGATKTLVGELSRKLSQWTGRRWMVVVSAEPGAPTVKAQTEAYRAELVRGVTGDPLVQAVLNRFPGAEIVDVRRPEAAGLAATSDEMPPAVDGDTDFADGRPDNDDA
jgi:DNA polymerase-3 subunit gamma/tau